MTAKRDIVHGTWSGYSHYLCRCDKCRAAANEYQRNYLANNPAAKAKKAQSVKEWGQRNRDKREAVTTAWRKKNPEKHREGAKRRSERFRLKHYGLTAEQHAAMLGEQNGVCAICRSLDNRQLSVDHVHGTGSVRGLLCRRCNLGLGCFGDDAGLLEAAIAYLRGPA